MLIKNAEVFDGIHDEGFRAHVVIEGDKIADVLQGEAPAYSGEVVDAGGLALSSGFIDTHSHNDFYAVLPEAHKYVRPFVEQGITTQITGNCGFSIVGIDRDTKHGMDLFGFFKENPAYREMADLRGWQKAIDRYSPVNAACLCGHGTIRASLAGLGPAPLSPDNLAKMQRLAEAQLEAGALGVSFGLMYEPSMYGSREELLSLARLAAKYGRLVTYHQRALSRYSTSYSGLFGRPHNLRAMDEMLSIARETGAKTHISHIIFVGRSTWSTVDETVAMIDRANSGGLDVSFDIYPWDFGASIITVVLPAWYRALPPGKKKSALTRLVLEIEMFATRKLLGFDFDDIQVAYPGPEHPEYTGKRISEIARESGIDNLSAYLKVNEDSGEKAEVIMYSYMNEHIIDLLSRHPRVSYMTDAWLTDRGMQNPASYGTFPKFLRLAREGKAESLGPMIRKMTGQAAERFGLKRRGKVAHGYFADLVVFDKDAVTEKPGDAKPEGIVHVLVNGGFALKDGEYTGAALGAGL